MARAQKKNVPPGLVKISKLAALSGVPSSTIKHYVRLGLLPPPVTRPNKQMAYYDEGLVDRIKAIKILQSERYLPLPAIKRILGEPPRPGEQRTEVLRAKELAALAPALEAPVSAAGFVSRKDVLAGYRMNDKELGLLELGGLVHAVHHGAAVGYEGTDAELLRVIRDTREAGLGALFPFDVLAPYVEAVRGLVKLEIDMFRHRVEAGVKMPDRPIEEVAAMSQALVERLLVQLRKKLVVTELRKMSAGGPAKGRGAASARRK